jgi:hypothetical protein
MIESERGVGQESDEDEKTEEVSVNVKVGVDVDGDGDVGVYGDVEGGDSSSGENTKAREVVHEGGVEGSARVGADRQVKEL